MLTYLYDVMPIVSACNTDTLLCSIVPSLNIQTENKLVESTQMPLSVFEIYLLYIKNPPEISKRCNINEIQ